MTEKAIRTHEFLKISFACVEIGMSYPLPIFFIKSCSWEFERNAFVPDFGNSGTGRSILLYVMFKYLKHSVEKSQFVEIQQGWREHAGWPFQIYSQVSVNNIHCCTLIKNSNLLKLLFNQFAKYDDISRPSTLFK